MVQTITGGCFGQSEYVFLKISSNQVGIYFVTHSYVVALSYFHFV